MDANDNEELIESLAPSAAMLPLLGSLSEALERLKTYADHDTVVLIENDLPDNYAR